MQLVTKMNLLAFVSTLSVTIAQTAHADDFKSVCSRAAPYRDFLTQGLGKTCDLITTEDLNTILRVDVQSKKISAFDPSDISNLPNLEILNLNANPFIELPADAFALVPELKTIVLIRTGLKSLPDDFLEKNPKIENLIMYRNAFTSVSRVVLDRIESLPNLKVLQMTRDLIPEQKDELIARFPVGGPTLLQFR